MAPGINQFTFEESMRQNYQTVVARAEGRHADFDIAIEKPGREDVETRYDVAYVAGDVITAGRNRKRFRLLPEPPQANPDHNQILNRVGSSALVAFARQQPATINGIKYYSLQQYLDANQAQNAPRGALAVTRVSPKLAEKLGFTPRIAVPL